MQGGINFPTCLSVRRREKVLLPHAWWMKHNVYAMSILHTELTTGRFATRKLFISASKRGLFSLAATTLSLLILDQTSQPSKAHGTLHKRRRKCIFYSNNPNSMKAKVTSRCPHTLQQRQQDRRGCLRERLRGCLPLRG